MHTIDRYVYPHDGRVDISAEGFLVINNYSHRYTDIIRANKLESGILLGEGGMGKTTFLKEFEHDFPSGTVKRVELAHYKNDPAGLRAEINLFRNSNSDRIEATLLIDGFDEAPELAGALGLLIRDMDKSIKLWIGSRDIPAIRGIKEYRPELLIYKLAPLRETDVRDMAQAGGIEPDTFIQALRGKGLTQICAKPLGCEFAISAFKDNDLTATSAKELWYAGIRKLCDETPSATKRLTGGSSYSLESMYCCAEWIALCTELSLKPFIWTGETSLCPENCIAQEVLTSETIPLEQIRDILSRGVFTPVGDGRVQFAQPEYHDFLTASAMQKHMPQRTWRSLLLTQDRLGVYIGRQQVATWLSDNEQFRDILFQVQPELLLRNEDIVNSVGKDRLCRHLLDHANRFTHQDKLEENFSKFLSRLKSDQTHVIIREYIASTKRTATELELAFRIVDACDLYEVADLLVQFVIDESEEMRVRTYASFVLAHIKDRIPSELLKNLKGIPLDSDDFDNLRGNVLRCLCPENLAIEELLCSLTPKGHFEKPRYRSTHS